MTDVEVSTGSSVSKRQQIGTCGTTGDSTGPQLHWEVQFGKPYGQRLEPENY
ncbi:M23 family metallopeptidase [Bacillus cereus]|uniref:M23 family metallopeptidase n=1 Tax=Bacillus cereus TaxID=1396 RepID=UPI002111826B|nr:M23 family metallopeptidase [Bacillus cereus]MCQ6318901.1 M23 family metallopeptidase [Bacillus cereus]